MPILFHDGLALTGFHIFGSRPGRLGSFLKPAFFGRGGTIHHHPTPKFLAELMGSSLDRLPPYVTF